MAAALVGRAIIVMLCALAALTGCSHRSNTPAAPSTSASTGVDALIVSVEDVRRIANYEELTTHAHANLNHPPAGDVNAPGPCRAAGTSDLTFAAGWTEFRSAGYSGVTDDLDPGGRTMKDSVSQAVAIYPDAQAARSALDQLEASLNACLALNDPKYGFKLDKPDPLSLRITDNGWSHQYRARKSVLMSVGVLGIEPAERIASTILDNICDRIK
ncbi:sensor domain-containing protein [Mycobacterium gordonae]|uniref:sensor domain-containing protein n=1 Tax=Mycobacterium gordonae TaxID=1778 RepID=UPI00210A8857|nr:sensor domain-containing protein [Mycobacterium gordonae]MCQ4359990.1 sensor domain-containing protein [Mycobacterium gordonae]